MMILAVRYSFLFWLTISESLLLRSMESDDQQMYRVSACVGRCLLKHTRKLLSAGSNKKQPRLPDAHDRSQALFDCYHFCRKQNSTSSHLSPVRKIQEQLQLELVCRDDRSLTFRIDSAATPTSSPESERSRMLRRGAAKDIFVIKIYVARGAQEYSVYLTDDKLFTIDALKHSTTYNVSAVVVHEDDAYSVIAKAQQFRSLRVGYTPGMVQDIQVRRFHIGERTRNAADVRLTAEINWRPAADLTCHYNIICFSPESEEYGLTPLEIRDCNIRNYDVDCYKEKNSLGRK